MRSSGGIYMHQNNTTIKTFARKLRKNMTPHEHILWYHLRRKNIHNVQFYRQRILGSYIVDFYAPSIRLVIEVDGSQHESVHDKLYDKNRDAFLASTKIHVIRFSNIDVSENLNSVLSTIEKFVKNLK